VVADQGHPAYAAGREARDDLAVDLPLQPCGFGLIHAGLPVVAARLTRLAGEP
jgi:hypothetical protein